MQGSAVHGIRNPASFTADRAAEVAKLGWLTDKQYYAILTNPERYGALHRQNAPLQADAIVDGNLDCLFLCNRDAPLDTYHYTLVDDPEYVTIGDTVRMTMVRHYSSNYEKREYFPRAAGPKIIHFGPNRDVYRRDLAIGAENALLLENHMEGQSQNSVDNLNAIADDLEAMGRGRGQRGRRGGRQGPI